MPNLMFFESCWKEICSSNLRKFWKFWWKLVVGRMQDAPSVNTTGGAASISCQRIIVIIMMIIYDDEWSWQWSHLMMMMMMMIMHSPAFIVHFRHQCFKSVRFGPDIFTSHWKNIFTSHCKGLNWWKTRKIEEKLWLLTPLCPLKGILVVLLWKLVKYRKWKWINCRKGNVEPRGEKSGSLASRMPSAPMQPFPWPAARTGLRVASS